MCTASYASYRGCSIEVDVTQAKFGALGGVYRRYRVSWTVSSVGESDAQLTSFPKKFDFLTEQEAFRYGEKRAHTFIDSVLSPPSQRGGGDQKEGA